MMPQHTLITSIGGKKQIAKALAAALEKIPHITYCEPFMGGANVFFEKQPVECEYLNDIDGELVNFFNMVKHHLPELQRLLDQEIISSDALKRFSLQNPESLTEIQRAIRFYYIRRTGMHGSAYAFDTKHNSRYRSLRLIEDSESFRKRLHDTKIVNWPWQKVLSVFDKSYTLFYLDPPYYNHENDYGRNVFSKDDWPQLVERLNNLAGKFVLSINDCAETRELFSGFQMMEISKYYSYRNRLKNTESSIEVSELLVYSNDITLDYQSDYGNGRQYEQEGLFECSEGAL